jgi:hypothetical protein
MSALLVIVKEMFFFSTEFKWDNSPPYCGRLPAIEKTEPEVCDT